MHSNIIMINLFLELLFFGSVRRGGETSMLDFILFMMAIVIIMCFANLAIKIIILFYPHYSLQLLLAIFIAAFLYSFFSNDDLKLHLKISKKKLIILLASLLIIFAIFLHHLETKKGINEHYGIHNMTDIEITYNII